MRSIRAEDYQDVPRRVAVMPKTFAAGSSTARHFHPRAQLLYATAGLMMATAQDGTWVVPEGHALWIPPRLPHSVAMHGDVAMCSAYLAAEAVSGCPARAQVIAVSPLLAAALAALTEEPVLYDEAGRGGHLAALVLDEIERAPETPVTLPWPDDARLRRVCLRLIEAPALAFDLDAWSDEVGVSRRTLTRGFRHETGLSLGQWRARARVVRALALRADGHDLRQIAAAVGYRSVQALRMRMERLVRHPETAPDG
jgi:AraC-like DNA-binding protein